MSDLHLPVRTNEITAETGIGRQVIRLAQHFLGGPHGIREIVILVRSQMQETEVQGVEISLRLVGIGNNRRPFMDDVVPSGLDDFLIGVSLLGMEG